MTDDFTNLCNKFKELYEKYKTTGDKICALRLIWLALKNQREWNDFYFEYVAPEIESMIKQCLENKKGETK